MVLSDEQKKGYERTILPGFQEDLTLIDNVSDDSIESILRGRYTNNSIYTAIGPLLFSVNPYRQILKDEQSIYSEDVARLYFNSSSLELTPHIFGTASDCYQDLRRSGQNQAVIVTGESGSGKTEAAKHIMTFLTFVCVDHIEFLNSLHSSKKTSFIESSNFHMPKEMLVADGSGSDKVEDIKERVSRRFESFHMPQSQPTGRRTRGGQIGRVQLDQATSSPAESISALRNAAKQDAELREIFDEVCNEQDLLEISDLKSMGQIEEFIESGSVSSEFIDAIIEKINETADDHEKDKVSFVQFKQVLQLIEEEIKSKEEGKTNGVSRGERPGMVKQMSAVLEYSDLNSVEDEGNLFEAEENLINPLQMNSLQDIRSQLMESFVILEAFGNSRTMRNDNSSRFAKYVELQFDSKMSNLVGGKITTFLLERSRLVHQIRHEYNFHVLYHMTCGSSEKERVQLMLQPRESYRYLMYDEEEDMYGKTASAVQENPRFTLGQVRTAMNNSGFTQSNLDDVFSLLSGILSLGNLTFEDNEDDGLLITSVHVADQQKLELCAHLLQIDPSALSDALVSHKLYQGTTVNLNDVNLSDGGPPGAQQDGRTRRITCAVKQHDVNYATISRDSLAKELYTRLFALIVAKLNEKIETKEEKTKHIGILDICGFEIFDVNRFEQFCINWANEKLHLFFIEQTLRAEKREYEAEGLGVTFSETILDNEKVVNTIEGREGIVALLDDQILLNDYNPDHFIGSVNCLFVTNKDIITPSVYKKEVKSSKQVHDFGINHYAGTVRYNALQFIEKNADTLYEDLMALMRTSRSPFIVSLCSSPVASGLLNEKVGSNKKPSTVGSQFRKHLNGLLDLLAPCNPRYVCCIKPNDQKSPDFIDSKIVKEQIKYLGMTKHVIIRQEGYAFRSKFIEFLRRYRILSTATWPRWDAAQGEDHLALCRSILSNSSPTSWNGITLRGRRLTEGQDYAFGRTKVFVKDYKAINSLEKMRNQAMSSVVSRVQAVFRMRSQRKSYKKAKIGIVKIQAMIRRHLNKYILKRKRNGLKYIQKCVRKWVVRLKFEKKKVEMTPVNGKLRGEHARVMQAGTRGFLARRRLQKDNEDIYNKLGSIKVRMKATERSLKIISDLKTDVGVDMFKCKLEGINHSMTLTTFHIVGNEFHWNTGLAGKNRIGIPLDPTSKIQRGGRSFKQDKVIDTGGSSLKSNPFMQAQQKAAAATIAKGTLPAPSAGELELKAISLSNASGTSEVIVFCKNEVYREDLYAALVNFASKNTGK